MCSLEYLVSYIDRFLDYTGLENELPFKTSRSLEDVFMQYWEIREVRHILKPPECNSISKKSASISNSLRNKGNLFYKERKFRKAVTSYNLAIVTAPHPNVLSTDENSPMLTEEYSSLAMGYANRSAVLFELNKLEECVVDIARALRYGYPKEKSQKLIDRKDKCDSLLKNRNCNKNVAKSVTENNKTTKDDTEQPPLTKAQKRNRRKRNKKNIAQVSEKDNSNEKEEQDTENLSVKHDLFYTGPLSPPMAKEDLNHGYGESIRVGYSAEKGRHLIAARDIKPGEIILSEKSQCSFVKMDSSLREYCTQCLRRAPITLPCPSCSLVVFCSEECQKLGRKTHGEICSVFPLLVAIQPDVEVSLAFLFLNNFFLQELLDEVNDIETNSNKHTEGSLKASQSSKFKPFLEQSNNYKSFYHLEGNIESKSIKELKDVGKSSVAMTQLLLMCLHYAKLSRNVVPISSEISLVGAQLMRLILNFKCNDHCIKELRLEPGVDTLNSPTNIIGYGIFSLISFLNHSCNPNVLNSNHGATKYVYSIAPIKKGEEIVDSYGERFASHSLQDRRTNLQRVYNFQCQCTACSRNWPLFKNLPEKLVFRNQHESVATRNRSDLKSAMKAYKKAQEQVNNYNVTENTFENLANFISFLDDNIEQPNQLYIQAQETLQKAFDLIGSQMHVQNSDSKSL